MKNNTLSGGYYPKNPRIKHFFRIMRITLFLLVACVFSAYAGNSYSQNTKVSLDVSNVKLNKVLDAIESQTDYLFIYNSQININKLVSIKAHEQAVSKVLDKILRDTGIKYKLEGSHIILERKEVRDTPAAISQQQTKKLAEPLSIRQERLLLERMLKYKVLTEVQLLILMVILVWIFLQKRSLLSRL